MASTPKTVPVRGAEVRVGGCLFHLPHILESHDRIQETGTQWRSWDEAAG